MMVRPNRRFDLDGEKKHDPCGIVSLYESSSSIGPDKEMSDSVQTPWRLSEWPHRLRRRANIGPGSDVAPRAAVVENMS
jgi:hypothetical protein